MFCYCFYEIKVNGTRKKKKRNNQRNEKSEDERLDELLHDQPTLWEKRKSHVFLFPSISIPSKYGSLLKSLLFCIRISLIFFSSFPDGSVRILARHCYIIKTKDHQFLDDKWCSRNKKKIKTNPPKWPRT